MLSHQGILPLYCPLQAIIRVLPFPLPSVPLLSLAICYPWLGSTYGLPGSHIMDNCRAFRRLLWAGNPCVHSLWHDPDVTTGFRCRFGACVINPTFACYNLRPLNEASPFDSPCAHFPGEFVLSGSILLRVVLWASHKSVTRYAHQSRDTLNGESGGFYRNLLISCIPSDT